MSVDEVTNDLQALVVGMLMGALMQQGAVDVDVYPPDFDEAGNYQRSFRVVGRKSGTKLRVEVQVDDRPDDDSDVAYIECLPAQEAAYWESRRRGWGLSDKQIGDLLRVVAPHLRGEP